MSAYTGLNFREVGQMDYIQYLRIRRDAYIHRMEQSPEGQEYLREAWRLEQTKPDRAALRKRQGKEAPNGQ